jgi:hypothetical protein
LSPAVTRLVWWGFQAAQRERAAIKPPREPALSPCAQRPLEERRDELSRVVHGVDSILFSEALSAEGALVFANACKLGLEGIVSKRAGSRYRSGTSRSWLKSKNLASCERRRDFSKPCGAWLTDLTSRTAGTNITADDPNGRMKAARDAMNKTIVSQFDIRSS